MREAQQIPRLPSQGWRTVHGWLSAAPSVPAKLSTKFWVQWDAMLSPYPQPWTPSKAELVEEDSLNYMSVHVHTHLCKCNMYIHHTHIHTYIHSHIHTPLFYSAFYWQCLEHLPFFMVRHWLRTGTSGTCDNSWSSGSGFLVLTVLLLGQWPNSYLRLPGRMTNQEAQVIDRFLLSSGFQSALNDWERQLAGKQRFSSVRFFCFLALSRFEPRALHMLGDWAPRLLSYVTCFRGSVVWRQNKLSNRKGTCYISDVY